jgi:hypothetical protein
MAVQYEDIRVLRARGNIEKVWTAADIAPYVNDQYPNQTLANHSACPCHQEKGYHCKINTKSYRFVRLGDGQYCLPEESPAICPIHNAKSMMDEKKFDTREAHAPKTSSGHTKDTFKGSSNQQLSWIVSNLKSNITNKNLNKNLLEQHIRNLSDLGFKYDQETYPELSKTELFLPNTEDSPQNLAEALLWKLGKWPSYKNFVHYYDGKNKKPKKTDIIFYAFANHLRDNNYPIFDQHTLRSMWAVDSSLTKEKGALCKQFLMSNKGKWKLSGGGSSGSQCYELYKTFIRRVQVFYNDLKRFDMLLMPLGQALKKNTQNYDEFCNLCKFNN